MNIIVQKFGGTSVSTKERRTKVIDKIIAARNNGKSVVVVVSAMGRKGDPYATDTLRSIVLGDNPYCSPKILDLLMSCGEIISAAALAAQLELAGIQAVPITGWQAGIETDDYFGHAEIKSIDEKRILSLLEQDLVVIVCGFQGATQGGEVTTLGRGGSDTTATALGVALGAEEVEIYTDVDGIMTADPNVVPSAKIIDEINYEEVFQMAEKGAKVIHPRAVEIAQNSNLPVKIKNTLSNHPGTIIHYHRKSGVSPFSTELTPRLLTAITHRDSVAQASVMIANDLNSDSMLLETLANAKISIDMINFFVDKKVFVIEENQCQLLKKLLDDLKLNYEIVTDCSKVTIIGSRITGIPGVMATIVHALAKEGINILQSSDSHSTISCLVHKTHAIKAVNVLHEAFHLNR
ncbi:aspartate kinase [Alkaliphilus crotonatoxidans]